MKSILLISDALTVNFEFLSVVPNRVGEYGILGATGERLPVVVHRRPELEGAHSHVAIWGHLTEDKIGNIETPACT